MKQAWTLGKTPWVDTTIDDAYMRMADAVGPALLPIPQEQGREGTIYKEYGCGYYGCVVPTATPGWVLKLTTDDSEAGFAQGAMNLAAEPKEAWPVGIVEYSNVFRIVGAQYSNPDLGLGPLDRPNVYGLWRQEATDIDYLLGTANGDDFIHNLETYRTMVRMIKSTDPVVLDFVEAKEQYEDQADEIIGGRIGYARDRVDADRRGIEDDVEAWIIERHGEEYDNYWFQLLLMQCGVQACENIAQFMENTVGQDTVGSALGYYQQRGAIMGDVHGGNVAKATHPYYDGPVPTITDPGVVLATEEQWKDVPITDI